MAAPNPEGRKPSVGDRFFGVAFFGFGIYLFNYVATSNITTTSTLLIWVTLIGLCFTLAAIVFTGRGMNITLVGLGK